MSEDEFRRRPSGDLRFRMELVEDALLAVSGAIAVGGAPADETERDRCRLVGERIASKARGVVDMLARPPGVVAAILRDADAREQGEEP